MTKELFVHQVFPISVLRVPQNLLGFYYDLWSLRDHRVDDWFLMSSIWPTILLCMAYWYCCIVIGPAYMKERPPMELKRTMQIYNVLNVMVSAYGCIEAFRAGWGKHYNWLCQPVELDTHPESDGMRMANVAHLYLMTKFLEFADTFFFMARKKFTHVTKLHLIHHGIMPMLSFILVRWVPGGHESFGGMYNGFVHVFMYSYYFLASLGPHMQKYLWWKKYLTTLQMIQFVCIFSKSMVVVLGWAQCGYPWQMSFILSAVSVFMFILFAEYYINEYNSRKPASVLKKKVEAWFEEVPAAAASAASVQKIAKKKED